MENSETPNNIIPMPSVMQKVFDVIRNPATADVELAKIITDDNALETKVLNIVNSPYFSFRQKVGSINKAIVILGAMKVKNIVLTILMKQFMVAHGDYELWEHSVKCAVACEFLAKEYSVMNTDDAFVVGFMHDIGKTLLNSEDPVKYSKVKNLASKGNHLLVDVEDAQFHKNHCTLGSQMSEAWKLPLILTHSIKYHHDPLNSNVPSVCGILYCSDRLVQKDIPSPIFDSDVISKLDFIIENPMTLRDTVLKKASIYLKEINA